MRLLFFLGCLVCVGPWTLAAHLDSKTAGDPLSREEDVFRRDVQPLLDAACIECHGGPDAAGEKARGGVDFTRIPNADAARETPELWAHVNELLELEEMPPPGHPRPAAGLVAAASPWLREMARTAVPAPQPATLRRLNGREFAATVRDLYGVDLPEGQIFGDDPVGHGYDTSAGVQTWNGDVMEAYLAAAEYVATRVFPADRGAQSLGRFDGEAIRAGKDGLRHLIKNDECKLRVDVPVTGRWRIRMGAFGQQAGPDHVEVELFAGKSVSAVLRVRGDREQPSVLEFDADLEMGKQRIGVRFLNDWYRPELEGIAPSDRNLVVQWFDVEGPYGAPEQSSVQAELSSRHGIDRAGKLAMLAELASAAWRRPVEATEMVPYAELVSDGDMAQVLQLGLTGILASPHFTFLLEARPASAEPESWAPLDGYALASRLSYFLWSSCPDASLLDLAASGELHDPQVLGQQAERMLADDRSGALAEGFAMQWLGLTGLPRHKPDRGRFPGFSKALARSMMGETQRLFLDVLRSDGGIRSLLQADWTFVDKRLARHYGIDLPQELDGEGFGRVALTATPRRGLLGHGSVLTMTSDPARTSPVLRGKWILENLLGTPPPPPPPGVGSLPEEGPKARGSLRKRLEAHRADPSCAVCHDGMDPLGFGLEGFDGVGVERKAQPDAPLDVSGELPDGRRFAGSLELIELLTSEPGLERHLASELLVYGLGRSLGTADREVLAPLWTELAEVEAGLRSTIVALVQSKPFTHFAPQQP